MSRLHVTQDSVLQAVCPGEVERARRPITRFGCPEYQRAMSHQVQRFDRPDPDLPHTTLYVIDKMTRLRVRSLRFGYDHSELLNVERVLREPFKEGSDHLKTRADREVSEVDIVTKLRQNLHKPPPPSPKLTFEQWKLKKEAEARIKSKLIEEAVKVSERQETEEEKGMEAWSAEKREEARSLLLEFQQRKSQFDRSEEKPAAQEEFKTWVKTNFIQLREAKRLERTARMSEKMTSRPSSRRGRSIDPGVRKIKVAMEPVGLSLRLDESYRLGSSLEPDDLEE